MTRIDLHVHSLASDGTDPPGTLPRLADAAGLRVFALTDHDTTAGWEAAIDALPPGLTLIRGAELSCAITVDGRRISMHLLAYLFEPAEPEFAEVRFAMRAARIVRVDRWEEMLREDGYDISLEPLREQARHGVVGRPHLAALLVDAGLAPNWETAFGPQWAGGRYRLQKADWDAFDAVRLVRGAGGVPVFAHPYARRRGPVVGPPQIVALAEAGLAGLEIEHPDHSPDDRAELHGLAQDLGIFATGGSDYHGTRKLQGLGAETTSPEALDELLSQASGAVALTG